MRPIEIEIKAKTSGEESFSRLADELSDMAKLADGDLQDSLKRAAERLRELGEQDTAISAFLALQRSANSSQQAMRAAADEAQNYAAQIAEAGPPTAQEAAAMQRLESAAEGARAEFGLQKEALAAAQAGLQRYGIAGNSARDVQARLRQEAGLVRDSVAGIAPAYDRAAAASAALGTLGVRSAADLRAEIAQVRAAMQTVEKDAGLTGAALQRAMGAGNGRLRELQRELRAVQGEMTLADQATGLLRTGLAQITGGNVIANAIGMLGNKARELGREFLAANLQMEGMRRALNAVYKDANVTASQIDFLRTTADAAGVSTGGLSDSFRSFAVSSKAANIPLETTNALFASVTRAGATLGLSGERVSLVLQALGQMAAKGTVSMEELRQQLGESLPGALSLSAKGLGLTEAQLVKLVESGGLAARDLFPALASSLRELQGETEGVTTSWERFKNALSIAAQNSGDAGGMQLLTLSIKALGAVVAVVVLPLTAFAEVVFGVAKAIGVLVGALATLSNPLQALGEIADQASARQQSLADSFRSLILGADKAAQSHVAAGAAIAQTGREAGAAAAGVAQVGAAHGLAAGAVQDHAAAQQAVAIATRIAADASLEAGAKWVQLGVQLREVAAAQDQQVKNSVRLAAAAKIEGDGLQALAALRGNDLEALGAAAAAAQANAEALDKVALAREGHLATLRAELEAKRELIAGNAEEMQARETELKAIQQKIDALDAEATAGRVAAESAKNDAAARRAAVAAYQDNAAAVGALRLALEQARVVQEAFESDHRRGLATDQQAAEAKRRVAEAQRLYTDALNDAVAAEQRKAAATASVQQLERVGLDLAMAKAKAAETKAIYDRNEYAVTQARIKQKEIEIAGIKLVAEQLKAEANALDAVTTKKIEALVLQGKWTDALAAEHQLLRQNAEAKRKQAEATETTIAQRERELKALKEGSTAHNEMARAQRNEHASRGENQRAIQAQEDAMDRLLMKYTLSAKYTQRQIALLEREAAAAERAAEAYRKKWNIDKEGFTLDANGKRQEMSVPTGDYVFQAAKNAGLTEAEALALMDRYFQNGRPTGTGSRNGLHGPSRDWFSIVNEAISKAVIDKARQNAGRPETDDAAGRGAATQRDTQQTSPDAGGRARGAGVVTRVIDLRIDGGLSFGVPTNGQGEAALEGFLKSLAAARTTSSHGRV